MIRVSHLRKSFNSVPVLQASRLGNLLGKMLVDGVIGDEESKRISLILSHL